MSWADKSALARLNDGQYPQHPPQHLPVVNSGSQPVPAPHDPTMLELLGIDHRDTSTQYCKAIRDYLKDGAATESSYKTMTSIMGSKQLLTPYAPTLAANYVPFRDARRAQ